MKIPFFDLERQHQLLQKEIELAIAEVIRERRFLKGRQVHAFEHRFAERLNARHVVATNSGTDAIFAALKAIDVGQGDEVITPAWSWVSTASVISQCGATPVFTDVDPRFYILTPSLVQEKITDRTRAVICVHLYGQPAEVHALRCLCDARGIVLIEDCAQAHLSIEQGKFAGTVGHIGAFSFYPTKNLGAYGDAGCVVTSDDQIGEKVRRLCNHGALLKDDHTLLGFNSRMDTMQAAVLLAKLPKLSELNAQRIGHAAMYHELLSGVSAIQLPEVRENTVHTFHIYAIRAEDRNGLQNFLLEKGVETMIHYPQAIVNLPMYVSENGRNYPVATELATDILSLPIFPELSEVEITYICTAIREFYERKL